MANSITSSEDGIYLSETTNNTVASNIVTNCTDGVSITGTRVWTGYGDNITTVDYWSTNNTIVSNTIIKGNCGIRIWLSSNNTITTNDIESNKIYGLYAEYSIDNTAVNNWWGSSTGPYNITGNPNGTGDNITSNITFSPWATSPFNLTMTLPNCPPIASFVITPLSGTTSTTFTVDASSSLDVEDKVSSLQVRWDWENDGVWDTTYTATKTATHTYSAVGTKTIKLEVKDTDGLTGRVTRTLIVRAPPLQVTITATNRLDSGATTSLTVRAMSNGSAIAGVSITLSSTSNGTFASRNGITNSNGEFTTIFYAPIASTQTICRVTAQASKTGYNSGLNYMDVIVGPGLFARLDGNQYIDSYDAKSSKRYSKGILMSEYDAQAWATYEFTLSSISSPTIAVQIRYTDNLGWWSNGPSLYLWHWNTSQWKLVYANIGTGTDIIGTVGLNTTDYVSSGHKLKVKVYDDPNDITELEYVQVIESWYSIVFIPLNWHGSMSDFYAEAQGQGRFYVDRLDALTYENTAFIMTDSCTLDFDKSAGAAQKFSNFTTIKNWANAHGYYGARYIAITDEDIWGNVAGLSGWGDTVVCEKGYVVITAHELGHSYGLLDEYVDYGTWQRQAQRYGQTTSPHPYPVGYPNPYPTGADRDSYLQGRKYGNGMVSVMGSASRDGSNRGYDDIYCKPWMEAAIMDKTSKSLFSPTTASVIVQFEKSGSASIVGVVTNQSGSLIYPNEQQGEYEIRLKSGNGTAFYKTSYTPTYLISESSLDSNTSTTFEVPYETVLFTLPTSILLSLDFDQSLVVEVVNATTNNTVASSIITNPDDTAPPTIQILSPTKQSLLNSTSVNISGVSSDDVEVQKVEVSKDGRTWTLARGTSPWFANLTLEDGESTIYARATDISGNTQTTTITVTIDSLHQKESAANLDFQYSILVGVIVIVIFCSIVSVLIWKKMR
jgi:parallel beta-helix repeat protein